MIFGDGGSSTSAKIGASRTTDCLIPVCVRKPDRRVSRPRNVRTEHPKAVKTPRWHDGARKLGESLGSFRN